MSSSAPPQQAAAAAAAAVGSTSSSSSPGNNTNNATQHHHRRAHQEDLLARTWRSIAQSVVLVTHKAEKVAVEANRETAKELNEATINGVLRSRLEWSRSIAYLEAKLEGKAEELKALQQYVQCHPKIGRRKRKRRVDVLVAGDDMAAAASAPVSEATPPAASSIGDAESDAKAASST